MNIIVIDKTFNKYKVMTDVKTLPPIGASVDLFYEPKPRIVDILMWPDERTLRIIQVKEIDIEAIVFVD